MHEAQLQVELLKEESREQEICASWALSASTCKDFEPSYHRAAAKKDIPEPGNALVYPQLRGAHYCTSYSLFDAATARIL